MFGAGAGRPPAPQAARPPAAAAAASDDPFALFETIEGSAPAVPAAPTRGALDGGGLGGSPPAAGRGPRT
jgi:hypothetical protein